MAEGARLESVYTATYRGFESPLTAIFEMRACTQVRALFFYILRRGDENPRPGFDNWRSQLDRPRACERAAPTKTPGAFLNNACVGPAGARPRDGPSNGERSESIPPHRHIRDESLCASTGFFSHVAPAGGMSPPTGVRRVATPPGQNEKDKPNDTFSLCVTGAC